MFYLVYLSAAATPLSHAELVALLAHSRASNRAAVVIPCHRVIKSDGGVSGYRWGPERKQKLLAAERE